MLRHSLFLLALITFLSNSATGADSTPAQVKTATIDYHEGKTALEGYLAYPATATATSRRPGILICPEWTGPNEHARFRARQLAALGYVALVADVYGKNVRPTEVKDCAATAGIYKKDRALLRKRVNAGLETLLKQPQVDGTRIAAIGYCFGGLTALELGRSGAAIQAIVSFHGDLTNPTPADARNIKAHVLILHGAADPIVPPNDVAAFEKEMANAGLDWQLIKYSGAMHSFTNKAANDPKRGAVYQAAADRRSFEAMLAFFNETLAGK